MTKPETPKQTEKTSRNTGGFDQTRNPQTHKTSRHTGTRPATRVTGRAGKQRHESAEHDKEAGFNGLITGGV